MSNVVVTGGYGFIGSHLVSALLDRGDTVTVFDFAKNTRDTSIDFDRHPNFRFVQGDVTDLAALEKALTPDVDTVFHLAAVVGVKNYMDDPLQVLDVNVIGTRNVLELSHRNGITRGVRQHIRGVRQEPEPAVGRGRRSRTRFDEDRAVELQHQQGHGRASGLRDARRPRTAGDGGPLLQCVWATAESDLRDLADRSPDPQRPPAAAVRHGRPDTVLHLCRRRRRGHACSPPRATRRSGRRSISAA